MDNVTVESSSEEFAALRQRAIFFGGPADAWDKALAALAVAMKQAGVTAPPSGAALPGEARAKLMEALASIAAATASEDSELPVRCRRQSAASSR